MPIQQLPVQSQLPPDLAGQLAQIQMRQQLSQALLGQSMQPINPARSSGRYIIPISPLEGLSKLGTEAVAGRNAMSATGDLSNVYAQANQRRNSALSDALLGDQTPGLPQQTDPDGVPGFNMVPGQPSQGMPQQGAQPSTQRGTQETPQDIYREALKVAPSFGIDAITLLGEGPYKVRLEAALRRQDPTEVSKLLTEQGIGRDSPEGKAAYAAKTNPIVPLREGAGGVQYGPDGKPFFSIFSPKLGQGQSLDSTGNVQVAPGYMAAQEQTGTLEATLAGKRSGSEASAKAPYELIDVVDPKSGLTYSVPKSSITGGGTPQQSANPVTPAAPGAAVVPPQGVPRGMPSKLSPQQTAEQGERGKALQEYNADLNQRANGARDNSIRLAELQSLNIDGSSGAMAKGKQKFGEYALALGMSPEWVKQNLANVPDMQAFEKLTLQLASQQAKQLTSRPTGAEFQQFIGANPNLTQTPQGRAKVMKFMQQMNDLTLNEQQQAQAFWDKNHTLDGFQSQFNKAIESDPKSLLNQLKAENVVVKKYNGAKAPTTNQTLQFSREEIDAEMKRRGLK